MLLFARPGASQFLYCGRCKVVEVELPSSRSSLVKLTFELLDFETTESTGEDKILGNNSIISVDGDEKSNNNFVRDALWQGIGGLRTSASYTDLVSTHKEEMEVLFGAYSRAAVEEKRLQRIVREARVSFDMQSANDIDS